MKRILFLMMMALVCVSSFAKKYPWKGLDHEYELKLISMTPDKNRVCKVWAVAGSPDKAIEQALQDAVAAALFVGIPATDGIMGAEPIAGKDLYEANVEYFTKFFREGAFMNYAQNVNKNYPSGENNMAAPGGRRVGINVKIDIRGLIDRLDQDGIKKKKIGL